MPTRGRPQFARQALACWMDQQIAAERQIVIVDDLDCRSFGGPPALDGLEVVYYLARQRLTVGAKRNLAVALSRGDLIVHWDDDDWSAPERLQEQVARLVGSACDVTGYHAMLFRDGGQAYRYSGEAGYAVGTSLLYRRSYWQARPFIDASEGEDNAFIRPAQRSGKLATAPAGDLMYATIHPGNTSRRELWREPFKRVA